MNVRLEWRYKLPKRSEGIAMVSEDLSIEEALLLILDLEKSGRLSTLSIVDERGVYWSKKELKKRIEIEKTAISEVTIYFDGGFDLQDRHAGQGAVVYYKQNGSNFRVRVNEEDRELQSNNESEYAALWLAVRELEKLEIASQRISCRGDSMVVIRQMSGEWPCYEERLERWMERIEQKLHKLGLSVNYELIDRKENKEADELATKAMKGSIVHAKKEIIA
ncbi:hypothetical protein A374_04624 [Fictibacillus macauensis ZFHKF-1]|uniref:RNase H type-1 domain-containing protein n=1 Tax=Fictibacillus macauensis ZFHKF-1 TaxID=1196324 RepID=I8AMC6_9BACL|nr:reverse transcriptase-like protein [Fictibacillus macauensis]EIT86829.1 hypothetical protein A374_04624 [Fictibacillus macauensis ZFHKF-1]